MYLSPQVAQTGIATRRNPRCRLSAPCYLLSAICYLLLAVSPLPAQSGSIPAPESLLNQGLQFANQKKFDKAIACYQRITLEYATSRYASDAQFYMAEAYMGKKNYAQAADEYQFLLVSYPTTQFYEEAMFKQALCQFRKAPSQGLDQSDLKQAREQLELFKEKFPVAETTWEVRTDTVPPDSASPVPQVRTTRIPKVRLSRYYDRVQQLEAEIATRAARKEYDAALLYARAEEYPSAQVYLQHVLEQYPQASVVPDVKYWLAVCYARTGSPDQARALLLELTGTGIDPRLRKLAERELARLP
jgi:outer membrane protein assembly factor BamD (BamD/ComL family)